MYQALYRKWRPRTFDDVVGQNHITQTLKRQAAENRLSHAYLFTGSRGTGKTSCAKILARAVNCEHPVEGNPCNICPACIGIENGSVMEVVELDAATNNGVDQVRSIRDEAIYSPATVRKRVYIIDEAHMVTPQAFNALLKILEEPPEHLMFIFATTEVHKILSTIRSRCQQFSFRRLSPSEIAGRLEFVAREENIPLTSDGASLLARLADGGMRDALSLLDQCAAGRGEQGLGEQEILKSLGLAGTLETAALMRELSTRNTGAALERLNRLYSGGKEIAALLNELSILARDLLLCKTAPRGGEGLLSGGYDTATLRALSEELTLSRTADILGRLQETAAGLNRSANRRIDAELCLVRLCEEALDDSPAGLQARVSRLEEWMVGNQTAETLSRAPRGQSAPEKKVSVRTSPSEPPDEDVSPPWEMEPPPEREEDCSLRNITPPPARESLEPHTLSDRAVSASAPQVVAPVGDFWPDMVARLKGEIPMSEYSYFSNPARIQGTIDGKVLTLWLQGDFIQPLISKRSIQAVERASSLLSGGPYLVKLAVGTPPPSKVTERVDRLDDLLAMREQFGGIITEETLKRD